MQQQQRPWNSQQLSPLETLIAITDVGKVFSFWPMRIFSCVWSRKWFSDSLREDSEKAELHLRTYGYSTPCWWLLGLMFMRCWPQNAQFLSHFNSLLRQKNNAALTCLIQSLNHCWVFFETPHSRFHWDIDIFYDLLVMCSFIHSTNI